MPNAIVQGRQQLFFGSNAADEDWRFKEKVTAILELDLQDRDDVFAISPVRARNTVGDLEELDVGFVQIDEPEKLFKFVQVRDRKGSQGRPWIQQILGQQDTVGISESIMVSTSSFTENVVRLAADKNVPLRLLHPLDEQTSFKWYPNQMHIQPIAIELCHCNIALDHSDGPQKYEVPVEKLDKPIIGIRTHDLTDEVRLISPRQWLNLDVINHGDHKAEFENAHKSIAADGKPHKMPGVTVEYRTPKPIRWVYGHNDGDPLAVLGVGFYIQCTKMQLLSPFNRKFSYIDGVSGDELAQIVIGAVKIQEMDYYAALVRHSCNEDTCKIGGSLFR